MTDAPGFTLIEVLIVLAVFGLVLLGIGRGVEFGVHAWNLQARLVAGRADLDAVDRTLRGLVARMDPGSALTPPRVQGNPASLAFTTDLPAAMGLQRHVDAALSVDGAHRLVLRWTPHLHSLQPAAVASSEAVLLTGVGAVRFAYLRPQGTGSVWADSWSGDALPRLVRIHLDFPDGDARRWPDIVAKPAQDRPRD